MPGGEPSIAWRLDGCKVSVHACVLSPLSGWHAQGGASSIDVALLLAGCDSSCLTAAPSRTPALCRSVLLYCCCCCCCCPVISLWLLLLLLLWWWGWHGVGDAGLPFWLLQGTCASSKQQLGRSNTRQLTVDIHTTRFVLAADTCIAVHGYPQARRRQAGHTLLLSIHMQGINAAGLRGWHVALLTC
jgi:hypothetical protein